MIIGPAGPKTAYDHGGIFYVPHTWPYDQDVVADAVAAMFDKVDSGLLIIHSQGGGPGALTAI